MRLFGFAPFTQPALSGHLLKSKLDKIVSFPDEAAKTETFAIRFSSADLAQTFKTSFDDAVGKMTIIEAEKIKAEEKPSKAEDSLEKQVSDLNIKDEKDEK